MQYHTVESLCNGCVEKRTTLQNGQLSMEQIDIGKGKSLSKADISIRRTEIFVPMVSA